MEKWSNVNEYFFNIILELASIAEEQKKRTEYLSKLAYIDELTGLFNRKAYLEDLVFYEKNNREISLMVIAMDVNGLKVVNDDLGHMAGDELIRGAAQCMNKIFGNYGNIYRIGGDEFFAVIFVTEECWHYLKESFQMMCEAWEGDLVNNLSISMGAVSRRDFPDKNMLELADVADRKMYEAKERHYAEMGIDRKGQHDAHKVLCGLYSKIMKINLTTDSYTIIDIAEKEITQKICYYPTISSWMYGFGTSGYVHKDDLKVYMERMNLEYLKKWFIDGHNFFSVYYKRLRDNGRFGLSYVEMIPAKDYSKDNMSLFLYVKDLRI